MPGAARPFMASYREFPEPISQFSRLPPVSKTELMGHFDQWVTDSDLSLTSVKSLVAEPESVGRRYLDRYAVWKTSRRESPVSFFTTRKP